MFIWYILDENNIPVLCGDTTAYISWREANPQSMRVDETRIGDVCISTVFLGLDHSYTPGAMPVLFETMIFGGTHDQYQDRCCTWEEAKAMHRKAVNMVVQRLTVIINERTGTR